MALTKCKECGEEISKKAKKCPKCGSPQKRTSLFTWFVLILILAWAYSYVTSEDNALSPKVDPVEVALNQVSLEFNWEKAGFDNIMKGDFTVINDSAYKIKDIEIKCIHFGKSGSRIDSNTRTIFDVVEKESSKTFKDFSMGMIHSQAEKSSCEIIDLKV